MHPLPRKNGRVPMARDRIFLWQRHARTAQVRRGKRSVHMMMSLAFLAPDIVEEAVGGRQTRQIGITRLTDLLPNWRKQREMLGLLQPA